MGANRGGIMNRNLIPYGLGALLLGIVGLTVQDFALQWQPVPASIPLHTVLAYVSAILLIAGAALIATVRWRTGALLLGSFYALWVVALHAPKVAVQPADLGSWLGLAEILGLSTAGLLAWAVLDPAHQYVSARVGQIVFGCCLLVYGTSHLVYPDFCATMVPQWLPSSLFWVYLTGAGHLAAGMSLISGIATRLASTLLVAMIACFVVLLHLPRVLAAPTNRVEWTMLAVSLSIFGAAWIVRATVSQVAPTTSAIRSPA